MCVCCNGKTCNEWISIEDRRGIYSRDLTATGFSLVQLYSRVIHAFHWDFN